MVCIEHLFHGFEHLKFFISKCKAIFSPTTQMIKVQFLFKTIINKNPYICWGNKFRNTKDWISTILDLF